MAKTTKEEFVIVRTRNAGVHCGTLQGEPDGTQIILTDARRVWRWRGANSLSELANNGCAMEFSRISEPVSKIRIPDYIEVLTCTNEAKKNLSRSRWGA